MLSKTILATLKVILKIGSKLGSFPYAWDATNFQVKLVTSKLKITQWYLTIFYIFINTAFMSLRLIQAVCCMHISCGTLFLNLFNVVNWLCGLAFHINTYRLRTPVKVFINDLLSGQNHKDSGKIFVLISHYQSFVSKF